MCDCDSRTRDFCSGLASCAVTTLGLDSKQLLGARVSLTGAKFSGSCKSTGPALTGVREQCFTGRVETIDLFTID
ncbi:hypothetical protein J6590_051785 [Homalodisca vitripennis]|nr:hypothetical protein J6590_051785 [Homalodisca vitripennis]